jgi:hypothetical protein
VPAGGGRLVAPYGRRVPRQLAAALALASVAVSLSTAPAAASWRAPVPGHVVRAFAYSARAPFARGARRGAELEAAAGERVVAPCSGPITFRGSVPRFGPAITIRCGALLATLLRVRSSRSGVARRGVEIGRAAGFVRLGARRVGKRWGYVDPIALIDTARPRLGPPPIPVVLRSPAPPPRLRRAVRPAGAPGIAWTAWAGIGLLGSLLGPWAISTSRRRSTTSTPRRTLVTRTR